MTRFALPVVVFAMLIAVFSVGLLKDPSKIPSPLTGKPAPEYTLPNLTKLEEVVSNTDYAGGYALVNVWASWCFACRQEHDFLVQLSRSGEIPIYGLNWSDQRQNALAWLSDLGDPYVASAFDADGRVGIDFGVYGAPETFLIDPNGVVLYKHVSPMTREIWEREFVPRIEKGAGG